MTWREPAEESTVARSMRANNRIFTVASSDCPGCSFGPPSIQQNTPFSRSHGHHRRCTPSCLSTDALQPDDRSAAIARCIIDSKQH
jgi:hypothetical protein